ncbi:aquaporin [Hoyosella rhizosphaerae]|uniref:Aquaporin Z n=1 Tax=Hoyosella rhizosphaerae TaxID=1755582 RepID=A0A916X909_9ACTN|nr:aquaporin [Hoyosella rhizosphaerae]MBN4926859.1 aquaporin [Hoyosella rhizosphaerae]GGC55956.1 aquaporin Z [Hoyosella rhizosphaerae]
MSGSIEVEETAAPAISDVSKFSAEAIGTFVLVFVAVGTAVFAGEYVGFLGIALAFGLTLVALAYAIGPISGAHVNPAVTLAFLILKRLTPVQAAGYVIAQVVGGLIAGVALLAVASGLPTYDRAVDGLGANGFGEFSPAGYGLGSAIIVEIVLTALLVFVVLASTDRLGNAALAGIPIGFTLAVIHLVSIPVDGTSVNPARSLAVAPFQDGALGQIWAFIVFPLIGGAVGVGVYRLLFPRS